jgi:hypothetical protein
VAAACVTGLTAAAGRPVLGRPEERDLRPESAGLAGGLDGGFEGMGLRLAFDRQKGNSRQEIRAASLPATRIAQRLSPSGS